jgi:hypothetical protein
MSARFKIHGMTDEPGHCELCGTFCPRRRVAVELIADDGSTTGDVQLWGVVCAAEARHGRRDSTLARQLQGEAEEAGAYTGPARGRRRMPAGDRPRRQTRREAFRLAAIAEADARAVWFRTSSPVPAALAAAEADGRPWLAAEARYTNTGHPRAAGHAYRHDDGRHAIVNSTSPADVARFERHGFRHVAGAELANWPTVAEALAATA